MHIVQAGRSVDGAVALVRIPENATMMRKGASEPTIHFLVGTERGCAMPVMIGLGRKGKVKVRPPSLSSLKSKEVLLALSFDTHGVSHGRCIDVLRGRILTDGEPNVKIEPQPKFERIDLRPIHR